MQNNMEYKDFEEVKLSLEKYDHLKTIEEEHENLQNKIDKIITYKYFDKQGNQVERIPLMGYLGAVSTEIYLNVKELEDVLGSEVIINKGE